MHRKKCIIVNIRFLAHFVLTKCVGLNLTYTSALLCDFHVLNEPGTQRSAQCKLKMMPVSVRGPTTKLRKLAVAIKVCELPCN